jgi:uncharacterized protein YlxW (UPF0749 family)
VSHLDPEQRPHQPPVPPEPPEPPVPAAERTDEPFLEASAPPAPRVGDSGAPGTPTTGPWRALRPFLAPRFTRGQLVAGLLCAILGFAVVVQVQQTRDNGLSALSQDELIRLWDEVTQRRDSLEQQAEALRAQREGLVNGADTERAALQAAQQRADVQGILSGQLPAQGRGVRLVLREGGDRLTAATLVDVMDELRNAGTEAMQVNGVRLTASTYLVDTREGVDIDGTDLVAPYVWLAIGNPDTIIPALEMPGGSLAGVRSGGGQTDVQPLDHVLVDATRQVGDPQHATPVPTESPSGD